MHWELGRASFEAGDFESSIGFYQRATSEPGLRKYPIGVKVMHTNNLAAAVQVAGYLDDATYQFRTLYQQVSKEHEKLGPTSVLTICTNLAFTYLKTGNLKKAISLLEKLELDSESQLGREHPFSLLVKYHLAAAYQSVGDVEKIKAYAKEVFSGVNWVLGDLGDDVLPDPLSEAAEKLLKTVWGIADSTTSASSPQRPLKVNSVSTRFDLPAHLRRGGQVANRVNTTLGFTPPRHH